MLPPPFSWIGMEIVRLVQWLDVQAARIVVAVRKSPTWFFVTGAGLLCIGLTILLFISMIEQAPNDHFSVKSYQKRTISVGRAELEKGHEWSAEDHWRIAHLFVPHKPPVKPKDIQLDSRLLTPAASEVQQNSTRTRGRMTAWPLSPEKPFDVRLDLSRPKVAQQGQRLIDSNVQSSGSRNTTRDVSRIRMRDPRLLVQAAWEFGSDCNQYAYAGLPTRRPVPQPLPTPEPLTPRPVHKAGPDLSFEMEMIRRFAVVGRFPPGSRLVTHSDRSVFPEQNSRFLIGLSSYGDSEWKMIDRSRPRTHDEIVPYVGSGYYDAIAERLYESDDVGVSLPSSTEVELRVELVTPRSVAGGQVSQSRLFVSNEGRETVSRIEVTDLVSHLQTVVDAVPAAMLEGKANAHHDAKINKLHREIHKLPPGEGTELDLKWIPHDSVRQVHRALVIAHAAVSNTTSVIAPAQVETVAEKHPALACDVQYHKKAYVGDTVELELTVRNTGDIELHDVEVRVEVPSQLSHRDGQNVVVQAGNLQVGGQTQTILKMDAVVAGDAVNVLQIAASEPIEARGQARILVVQRDKATPPLPETIRKAPAKESLPVIPAQPANGCCCQQLSMNQN